ncbi:MAG: flagellar biosynthetic protein FliO [Lachnospiraceae bacterium]|nr:flagellar biosynthetic protein FliO [Lachnospiraceae bacterium]
MILLSASDSYAQLITMLIVFVVVLAVTAFVTKWLANYQKAQNSGRNTEIIETTRLANNKWLQIVRVGKTIKVLAISKDNVTYLGDIDPAELKEVKSGNGGMPAFRSMFEKAKSKENNSSDDAKEDEL